MERETRQAELAEKRRYWEEQVQCWRGLDVHSDAYEGLSGAGKYGYAQGDERAFDFGGRAIGT
jgi:hypothetical protein